MGTQGDHYAILFTLYMFEMFQNKKFQLFTFWIHVLLSISIFITLVQDTTISHLYCHSSLCLLTPTPCPYFPLPPHLLPPQRQIFLKIQVPAFQWLPITFNIKATFDLQKSRWSGSCLFFWLLAFLTLLHPPTSCCSSQGLDTVVLLARNTLPKLSRDLLPYNKHILRQALLDHSVQSYQFHSPSTLHHFDSFYHLCITYHDRNLFSIHLFTC